jgi:hypothetical protein
MLVVARNGDVSVVERTPSNGGGAFTFRRTSSLGIDRLSPLQPDEIRISSKGVIDAHRRALWIPVTTAEVVDPAGCDFWSCDQTTGKGRSQYLYRIDLEQAIASGPRARYVRAPSRIRAGNAFSIRLTTTHTEPIDRVNSGVVLYENDSSSPMANIPWRRS